jgi:hypothetical protein
LVVAAAISVGAAAAAESPAPTLIGVQQVLVACDIDDSLSRDERSSLCEQLVRKAQAATRLPVKAATAADIKSRDLRRLGQQLLLRVEVAGMPIDGGRKLLKLKIVPVRKARPQGEMGALDATASLVKVQDDWVVQGHIDAFDKLLGGAPRELQRPIRSDV